MHEHDAEPDQDPLPVDDGSPPLEPSPVLPARVPRTRGAVPDAYPSDHAMHDVTDEDRTMALLAHLLTFVGGFIAPLIIWLVFRERSEFVDHHGREALNFQISLMIWSFAAVVLSCIPLVNVLVVLLMMVGALVACVLVVVAAIEASKGRAYRYPGCLRLVK